MSPGERRNPTPEPRSGKPDDNAVERAAKYIVPPGTEVADKDIEDPGKMTPDAPPADNRS